MLTVYTVRDHHVEAVEDVPDATWVDLHDGTDIERRQVEGALGVRLPRPDDIADIEASARSFEDDDGVHVRAYFLSHDSDTAIATVAFVLTGDRLVSVESSDVLSRPSGRLSPLEPHDGAWALRILLRLFEDQVDYLADRLEQLHSELERIGKEILETVESELDAILSRLTTAQDVNDKIRLCLMDQERALSFLVHVDRSSTSSSGLVRETLKDIESLSAHSTFLFEKVQFLMDAVVGKISVRQNQVVKLMSALALILLPPTLIASIYGMNFRFMPELDWRFGYPFVILLMILSAVLPYWILKRKKWL